METKGTIFIAEDNESNLKLAKDVLEAQGYNVEFEKDGQKAVDAITQKNDQIDLILMDLQLPTLDGYEATRLLKHNDQTKNIPIIVISAHAMECDIQRAKLAGCQDYITKPLNLVEFISKINSYFN